MGTLFVIENQFHCSDPHLLETFGRHKMKRNKVYSGMVGTEVTVTNECHELYGKSLVAVSDWFLDEDKDPFIVVITPSGDFRKVDFSLLRATGEI